MQAPQQRVPGPSLSQPQHVQKYLTQQVFVELMIKWTFPSVHVLYIYSLTSPRGLVTNLPNVSLAF